MPYLPAAPSNPYRPSLNHFQQINTRRNKDIWTGRHGSNHCSIGNRRRRVALPSFREKLKYKRRPALGVPGTRRYAARKSKPDICRLTPIDNVELHRTVSPGIESLAPTASVRSIAMRPLFINSRQRQYRNPNLNNLHDKISEIEPQMGDFADMFEGEEFLVQVGTSKLGDEERRIMTASRQSSRRSSRALSSAGWQNAGPLSRQASRQRQASLGNNDNALDKKLAQEAANYKTRHVLTSNDLNRLAMGRRESGAGIANSMLDCSLASMIKNNGSKEMGMSDSPRVVKGKDWNTTAANLKWGGDQNAHGKGLLPHHDVDVKDYGGKLLLCQSGEIALYTGHTKFGTYTAYIAALYNHHKPSLRVVVYIFAKYREAELKFTGDDAMILRCLGHMQRDFFGIKKCRHPAIVQFARIMCGNIALTPDGLMLRPPTMTALQQERFEKTQDVDVNEALCGQLLEAMNEDFLRVMDVFKKMDTSGDGFIDRNEFKAGIEKLGINDLSHKQMTDLFQAFDSDGSGDIDYEEMRRELMKRHTTRPSNVLWAGFRWINGRVHKVNVFEVPDIKIPKVFGHKKMHARYKARAIAQSKMRFIVTELQSNVRHELLLDKQLLSYLLNAIVGHSPEQKILLAAKLAEALSVVRFQKRGGGGKRVMSVLLGFDPQLLNILGEEVWLTWKESHPTLSEEKVWPIETADLFFARETDDIWMRYAQDETGKWLYDDHQVHTSSLGIIEGKGIVPDPVAIAKAKYNMKRRNTRRSPVNFNTHVKVLTTTDKKQTEKTQALEKKNFGAMTKRRGKAFKHVKATIPKTGLAALGLKGKDGKTALSSLSAQMTMKAMQTRLADAGGLETITEKEVRTIKSKSLWKSMKMNLNMQAAMRVAKQDAHEKELLRDFTSAHGAQPPPLKSIEIRPPNGVIIGPFQRAGQCKTLQIGYGVQCEHG